MIVAYVNPQDTELRQQVEAAVEGAPVTFRDPAFFEAGDADPLDHVVYVAQDAQAIRAAYANRPNVQMLALEDSPLATPQRSYLERRQQQRAARAGQPVDAAAAPNVRPPDLTNPATGRIRRSAADETVAMQRAGIMRGVLAESMDQAGEEEGTNPVQNRLEGVKRVGGVGGRRSAERAQMVAAQQAGDLSPVPDAPLGGVRPNASARLQTTEAEPGPAIVTLQKPADGPMPGTNPLALGPVVEGPVMEPNVVEPGDKVPLRAGQRRSTAPGEQQRSVSAPAATPPARTSPATPASPPESATESRAPAGRPAEPPKAEDVTPAPPKPEAPKP